MTRCHHCNKPTHSEHLDVEVNISDMEKVKELQCLESWQSAWSYQNDPLRANEYGKMKCGDIWIHFILKRKEED